MQDLYIEHYKILLRETKGDLDKWRDIQCLQTGEQCYWDDKFSQIYRFNTIPKLMPAGSFIFKLKKLTNLTQVWRGKGSRISKIILKKVKQKVPRHFFLFDLKIFRRMMPVKWQGRQFLSLVPHRNTENNKK